MGNSTTCCNRQLITSNNIIYDVEGPRSDIEKSWSKLNYYGLTNEKLTDNMYSKLYTLPHHLQELFHRSNRKEFGFLFSHIFKYLLLYSRKSEEEYQELLYKIGTTHVQFGINYETWNVILNLLLISIAEVAAELPENIWDNITRDSWYAFFSASFSACAEKCTKTIDITDLRARRKRIEKTRDSTFSSTSTGASANDGLNEFLSTKVIRLDSGLSGAMSETNSVTSFSPSNNLGKVAPKSPYLGSPIPDTKTNFLTPSTSAKVLSPVGNNSINIPSI